MESATRVRLPIVSGMDSDADWGDDGRILSPQALTAALKGTKRGDVVALECVGPLVHVRANGSRAMLDQRGDADAWPELPWNGDPDLDASPREWHAGTFLDAIRRVAHAMSDDANRYNLCGAYLTRTDTGELRLVATDGHRMAVADPTGIEAIEGNGHILGKPAIDALAKLKLGKDTGQRAYVSTVGKYVRIAIGETTLLVLPIDGEYPNYRQILPNGVDTRATAVFDAPQIRSAIDAAHSAIKAGGKNTPEAVKLELLCGSDTARASTAVSEAELTVSRFQGAEKGEILLSAPYLRDTLSAFPDARSIRVSMATKGTDVDPLCAVEFSDPENPATRAILMPMRG